MSSGVSGVSGAHPVHGAPAGDAVPDEGPDAGAAAGAGARHVAAGVAVAAAVFLRGSAQVRHAPRWTSGELQEELTFLHRLTMLQLSPSPEKPLLQAQEVCRRSDTFRPKLTQKLETHHFC